MIYFKNLIYLISPGVVLGTSKVSQGSGMQNMTLLLVTQTMNLTFNKSNTNIIIAIIPSVNIKPLQKHQDKLLIRPSMVCYMSERNFWVSFILSLVMCCLQQAVSVHI